MDDWKGGHLRLYMPFPPVRGHDGKLIERVPYMRGNEFVEDEYEPLGNGWAIRTDLPLGVTLEEPDDLRGIHVHLDMRDGRFQCVALMSEEGAPALVSTVLRRLGPVIANLAADWWPRVVVRLVEHEGTVVAEMPLARPTELHQVVGPSDLSDDVTDEYERRHRRPGRPRDEERLRRVARLYREAQEIPGMSPARYIAEKEPGYAPATYRSWIRRAQEFIKGEEKDDV